MARGLPASVAFLCAVAGLRVAHADDRRKVAVIDLSGDASTGILWQQVYDQLQIHWALRALGDPNHDAALQGAFLDEDRDGLETARKAQAAADEALAQFQPDVALTQAKDGQQALTSVTPTIAAPIYAELAFALGQAELGVHKKNEAIRAFALSHRLDPAKQVDPNGYDTDIVNAYGAAKATKPQLVTLEIQGTGRAWIDGVEVGPAPGSYVVEAGLHLVQLTGPDIVVIGQAVELVANKSIAITAAVADEKIQISRARKALAQAPADAVSRAGPMKQLAELLGVHDAVLISKRDDRLIVQTWRDHAPGFSREQEHGNEKPIDLLEPLAPPRPPEPPHVDPPPVFPPVHHEDEPAWYRKRWVQASVAGGVLLVVVGAIIWAERARHVSVDPNITSEGM